MRRLIGWIKRPFLWLWHLITLENLRATYKRKMSESLLAVVADMPKEGLQEVSIRLRTHKLCKGKS